MKVFAFTLLILLTSIACVQAQTISGSVADRQTKQPLAYCSVALFKSPDSTLVTGLLTSENGAFKFENVTPFSANVQGGLPAIYRYDNLHNPLRFGGDVTFNARSEKWDVSLSGNYLRNDIAGQRTGDVNTTIGQVFTSFPSDGERSFIRYNYTARGSVSFTPRASDAFSVGFYTGFRSQSRRADIVYNNTKRTCKRVM